MNSEAPIENNHLPHEVFVKILPTFIREAERLVERMYNAYARNDLDVVKRCAHTLKGAALSFGAAKLSALCKELDDAVSLSPQDIPKLLRMLDQEFMLAVDYSRNHFELSLAVKPTREIISEFDHILLIDDDPSVCAYNKALLNSTYPTTEVLVFTEAPQAIGYIANLKLEPVGQLPILILVDFYMPEIDGFQFMQAVEKLDEKITKHLCIFLLTLHATATASEMVHAFPNMKDVLSKPLNIDTLQSKLVKVV